MINKKTSILVVALLCAGSFLYAGAVDFYIKDNDLYITNKEEQHTYRIKDISSRSAITIHIPTKMVEEKPKIPPEVPQEKVEPKEDPEAKDQKPSEAKNSDKIAKDRLQLNKFLLESREFYQHGQLKQAWEMLDLAEEIDKQDYRIMTMKGSILMEMGDPKLGVEYWKKSLQLNPQQADLREKIKSFEKDKK